MRKAAFDLGVTLIRRKTPSEAIAETLGNIQRMREFEPLNSDHVEEVKAAREEMAEWYS